MPSYFRNLSAREVLSVYRRLGFVPDGSGRGPHSKMTHEGLGLTVFIPRHRGPIPLGTVADMVRRSRVTDEEFLMALGGNVPERFQI